MPTMRADVFHMVQSAHEFEQTRGRDRIMATSEFWGINFRKAMTKNIGCLLVKWADVILEWEVFEG